MTIEEDVEFIRRKLSALEGHLVNLIVPIQNISEILSSPQGHVELINAVNYFRENAIQIDDRKIRATADALSSQISSLTEKIPELDLSQALSEMKYIGKRMLEMEKILHSIEIKGISSEVVVKILNNGKEQKDDDVIYEPREWDGLENFLKFFPERTVEYLRKYIENKGKIKISKAAQELGISASRVSQIKNRCARMMQKDVISKALYKIEDKNIVRLLEGLATA